MNIKSCVLPRFVKFVTATGWEERRASIQPVDLNRGFYFPSFNMFLRPVFSNSRLLWLLLPPCLVVRGIVSFFSLPPRFFSLNSIVHIFRERGKEGSSFSFFHGVGGFFLGGGQNRKLLTQFSPTPTRRANGQTDALCTFSVLPFLPPLSHLPSSFLEIIVCGFPHLPRVLFLLLFFFFYLFAIRGFWVWNSYRFSFFL